MYFMSFRVDQNLTKNFFLNKIYIGFEEGNSQFFKFLPVFLLMYCKILSNF